MLLNNLLSGTIPQTLRQCSDLYKLDLSYNALTGSIPQEISGVQNIIIFLNLSNNHLDGPLPVELSKLKNVQEIDISSNNLTGSIFPEISNSTTLRMINFSRNSLQGNLLDSLSDLKSLALFDVSGNNLSGMIPTSFNKIQTLTFLNLSFNNFEGPVPSGGFFNSATKFSFLGNPQLCGSIFGMSSKTEIRFVLSCWKDRTRHNPSLGSSSSMTVTVTYKTVSGRCFLGSKWKSSIYNVG